MSMTTVDYFAIVLATVVSMIVGTIWYTALARNWQRAARLDVLGGSERSGNYIVAAVSEIVMATVFALLLAHFQTVTLGDALLAAFFLWLGFVETTIAVNRRFQRFGWDLALIRGRPLAACAARPGPRLRQLLNLSSGRAGAYRPGRAPSPVLGSAISAYALSHGPVRGTPLRRRRQGMAPPAADPSGCGGGALTCKEWR